MRACALESSTSGGAWNKPCLLVRLRHRTHVCALTDQERELHDDLELGDLVVLHHALELLDPHGLNVADRLGRALNRLPDRVLEAADQPRLARRSASLRSSPAGSCSDADGVG